jgi:hypothetical protein
MIFNLLTDSFFVAICLSIWLFGGKYRTVWYHPASSKFLSNYFSSFVSFRKIDWHASDSTRVLSQLRSACCVLGAGADFASTAGPPRSGEASRLGSMDPVAEQDQVRAAWWQEKQDEVVYGFLVEPQNQS